MRDKLNALLGEFLAERRSSVHGGWAQITPKDVTDLEKIVTELIRLKCEPDASSDFPIQVILNNRRQCEQIPYEPVRYSHDVETDEELERIINASLYNLQQAMAAVNSVLKIKQHREVGSRQEAKTKS